MQLSVAERKRLEVQATVRDCTVEQVLRDAIAAFCDHGKGEPKSNRLCGLKLKRKSRGASS